MKLINTEANMESEGPSAEDPLDLGLLGGAPSPGPKRL